MKTLNSHDEWRILTGDVIGVKLFVCVPEFAILVMCCIPLASHAFVEFANCGNVLLISGEEVMFL